MGGSLAGGCFMARTREGLAAPEPSASPVRDAKGKKQTRRRGKARATFAFLISPLRSSRCSRGQGHQGPRGTPASAQTLGHGLVAIRVPMNSHSDYPIRPRPHRPRAQPKDCSNDTTFSRQACCTGLNANFFHEPGNPFSPSPAALRSGFAVKAQSSRYAAPLRIAPSSACMVSLPQITSFESTSDFLPSSVLKSPPASRTNTEAAPKSQLLRSRSQNASRRPQAT